MFNRKNKLKDRLIETFGKPKDDSFNFEPIEKYFRKKDHAGTFQVLSDKTCNDLDFQELFMFLDRTTSKVGQQFLYNTLRTIPSTDDKFTHQEVLIQKISEDANLRLTLQIHLNKLVRDETYFITSLFQDEHLKKPEWFIIIRLLSFTSLMSILLLPFNPHFFLLLLAVFIINMAIHYWNKRNLYQYLGSIPQLLRLNAVAKQLLKYDLFNEISRDIPDATRTIGKVRNHMSFFKLDAKFESDTEIAFWIMLELFKTLFLLEPLLLFGVLKQLDTKRNEIEKVFSFVGHVDSLISIASLRKGLEVFCLPEIKDEGKIFEARDICHPLIVNCIPNTIQTKGKSILLTGSNMSGKTSFIRAIGINVITALTINTCFATQLCLSKFKIYSAIRISDDLMNDKSYYFEEVLTIKDMIDESQNDEPNLFLLDEIFKGTNARERISAGKAVLSYLNHKGNIIFVSTHDIELADMLLDSYELYHFSEQVGSKSVDFDYKLKEGKMKNRNAIKILQLNGYPELVIQEAIEILHVLDEAAAVKHFG